MKKLFVGCFNRSVIVTYIGISCSLAGIYALFRSSPIEGVNRFDVAAVLLIIAGICDLFDGVVARRCKRNNTQKQFGIELDSLVDVVSFLVFPSVFVAKSMMADFGSYWNVITILSVIGYVICGITRLAWFNITTEGDTVYYQGLPVTYAALILPLLYAVNCFADFKYYGVMLLGLFILCGILFVLNIKIKKPKGVWYIVFSLLAVAAIAVILI